MLEQAWNSTCVCTCEGKGALCMCLLLIRFFIMDAAKAQTSFKICKCSALLPSALALELWPGALFPRYFTCTKLWSCLLRDVPVTSVSHYFSSSQSSVFILPCIYLGGPSSDIFPALLQGNLQISINSF